jgi:exodeoxyribonuclease V alpha subunit
LGIHPNSEFRYRCCILHVLGEAAEDGHCFLPQAELVEKVVGRLALPDHRIEPEDILSLTTDMSLDEELIMQGGTRELQGQFLCYAPAFFHTEQGLTRRVQQLLRPSLTVDLPRVKQWIDRFTGKTGLQLSVQQRQAATHRVLILTGGPGVGKSFTCRTIVSLWKAMGKAIALASPTGRAAQRLSEMTGQEAKTIHRLLEFDPKNIKFKRDQDSPIPADAVVVDEALMLDLFLAKLTDWKRSPKPRAQTVYGSTSRSQSKGCKPFETS